MVVAKPIKHTHNKQLGKVGEELAATFLQNLGFTVLDKNKRTTSGEIDIIASKNEVLYCVEVKTRTSIQWGYPAEAITPRKHARMRSTAYEYAQEIHFRGPLRLLVVEILNGECKLIEI